MSRLKRRLRAGLCVLVLFLTNLLPLSAQKKEAKGGMPQVVVAMPLAIEAGKTTKITLRGLRIDSVTKIHVHEPKSMGKVLGMAKKIPVPNQANPARVGDSEIDIEITLPSEVPGAVVPFSVVNSEGESKPHNLIVKSDLAIIAEKEPNDGFKQAQPISLPCIVEGKIGQAQDVDVFRFEGKQGERIVFEIQANRFGSPLDGLLTLFDDAGRTVTSNDDSPDSSDPRLAITLPRTGTYFLSLIDANDEGGNVFVYRLIARTEK